MKRQPFCDILISLSIIQHWANQVKELRNLQARDTERLGTERVGRLLMKLSIPAITAQIINMLYNLVDRMYIGHMEGTGKLALTGMGVCLPLIMVISAFAALVSMGSASRASIYLGKGDTESAEKTLGNSVTLLFLIALTLTVILQLFARPLLLMFGASENTIGFALDYMRIYSLGTLFVQFTLGLNAFITAQGFSRESMLTVVIGAVINIILDPVFIFVLNMGVRGAALATVISQCVSTIWILRFLTGRRTTLHIRRECLRLNMRIMGPCLALGLAPFIMQSTESLLNICFNSSLLRYGGDLAVGAMTILTSVMQLIMLPLTGLTQGSQPIVSYNFGARNPGRVREAFKWLLICCAVYAAALWACVMIAPQAFARLFSNDEELIAFTMRALRIYMAAGMVLGVQIACQQTFIALGNAKSSLFLALLRKVMLLIPLIYIMPALMADKTAAVFMAEPVADLIAVSTTAILFFTQFRRLLRGMEAEPAR